MRVSDTHATTHTPIASLGRTPNTCVPNRPSSCGSLRAARDSTDAAQDEDGDASRYVRGTRMSPIAPYHVSGLPPWRTPPLVCVGAGG